MYAYICIFIILNRSMKCIKMMLHLLVGNNLFWLFMWVMLMTFLLNASFVVMW